MSKQIITFEKGYGDPMEVPGTDLNDAKLVLEEENGGGTIDHPFTSSDYSELLWQNDVGQVFSVYVRVED